jgi:cytochrome oxidase assembly protein ShyY1
MERPDLIPRLTPKEKNEKEYEIQMAKAKERIARINEKMANPPVPMKQMEKKLEVKEEKKFVIPEMNKATGEHLDKEYVLVDGHMVLKEFADK